MKIHRIPILPFGMVNAHLLVEDDACVLVDAGLPGSESKVARALQRIGLSFQDLKLIVVTHAHVDHAGSAAAIRELSGAPIVGHQGDVAHFRREEGMSYCPTDWFGRLFLRSRLMLQPYTAFTPDIVLTGDLPLDLAQYGVRGRVKPTPGHTAGSLSVELPSRVALVGDLVASGVALGGIARIGTAKRPPFEDDPQAVAVELQRLVDSGIDTFYMGHGGPLDAAEVQRHARHLRELRRLPPDPRSEPGLLTP